MKICYLHIFSTQLTLDSLTTYYSVSYCSNLQTQNVITLIYILLWCNKNIFTSTLKKFFEFNKLGQNTLNLS